LTQNIWAHNSPAEGSEELYYFTPVLLVPLTILTHIWRAFLPVPFFDWHVPIHPVVCHNIRLGFTRDAHFQSQKLRPTKSEFWKDIPEKGVARSLWILVSWYWKMVFKSACYSTWYRYFIDRARPAVLRRHQPEVSTARIQRNEVCKGTDRGPMFPQYNREQPWLIRDLLHGFVSEKEAEYLVKILDRQWSILIIWFSLLTLSAEPYSRNKYG